MSPSTQQSAPLTMEPYCPSQGPTATSQTLLHSPSEVPVSDRPTFVAYQPEYAQYAQPSDFGQQPQPPVYQGIPAVALRPHLLGNINRFLRGGVAVARFVPPGPESPFFPMGPWYMYPRNILLGYCVTVQSPKRNGPGTRCEHCSTCKTKCEPVTVLEPNNRTFPSCFLRLRRLDTNEGRLSNKPKMIAQASAQRGLTRRGRGGNREGNRARAAV
jgi:hypothetical protein